MRFQYKGPRPWMSVVIWGLFGAATVEAVCGVVYLVAWYACGGRVLAGEAFHHVCRAAVDLAVVQLLFERNG